MSVTARLTRLERRLLADDRAPVPADPVALMGAAGITPDPWQAEALRSPAGRLLLNCSRQAGKSVTAASLAVHTALRAARRLVLLLAPTQRQSGELLHTCADIYSAGGRPVLSESESALQLRLRNGSRIIALPGKEATIRGYSGVHLLVIDEAARVPDALYYSVRPMLAVSAGRLVCLSTPFGTRGFFYEAWEHGGTQWERYEVPATECPRISASFLEEERRNMGDWWYAQEYECRFLDAQSAAFRREDIDNAFKDEVETWNLR